MKKMLFNITNLDNGVTGQFLVPLSNDEFEMALTWEGKDIFDDDHPTTILCLRYGISDPYGGAFEDMARDEVPSVWLSRLLPHQILTPGDIEYDGAVSCTLDI